MAVRGEIHVNEPPTDYQARSEMTAEYHQAGIVSSNLAELTMLIQYGQAYNPGVFGIRVYTADNFDQPTGVSTNTVEFDSPWYTNTWTNPGYLLNIAVWLEVDQLQLTVAADCSWTLSFSELRILIGGVLMHTIAAQTQSGTGFDLRLDTVTFEPLNTPHPTPPEGAVTCEADFGSQPTHNQGGSTEFLGGLRWWDGAAWRTDTVAIDPSFLPEDDPLCGCEVPLPGITTPDSWDLHGRIEWSDITTKVDDGNVFCPCPNAGDPGGDTWNQWHVTNNVKYQYLWLHAIPTTSGILKTERISQTNCSVGLGGGGEEFDSDVFETGSQTFSEFRRRARQSIAVSCCASFVSKVNCLPITFPPGGDPSGPRPCYCPDGPTFCNYDAFVQLTWPEEPPCQPGDAWPTYDVSFGHRHFVGWIRGGTFWTAYSDNAGGVWTETDSGISALRGCARVDRQLSSSPLWAWVQTPGGTIDRYESLSEGKTWGMPTTISSGAGNRTPADIIGRNGVKYQYWVVPSGGGFDVHGRIDDRAGNVMVAEFTAVSGVDDAGIAADEFVVTGGHHKIRLWVIIAGAKTAYLSDEGKVFV